MKTKDNETIDDEINQVIEVMREIYPTVIDYNVKGEDYSQYCHLLDKDGKTIKVISERALTHFWNLMEGG